MFVWVCVVKIISCGNISPQKVLGRTLAFFLVFLLFKHAQTQQLDPLLLLLVLFGEVE